MKIQHSKSFDVQQIKRGEENLKVSILYQKRNIIENQGAKYPFQEAIKKKKPVNHT